MGLVNLYSFEKKSWVSLFDFFNLYPISGGILFACFGWIASIMFETICDELVKEEQGLILHNKYRNRKTELVKLKQRYLMIVDLVDGIQRCFGLFLLIVISGNFCRMITSSFQLMNYLRKRDWFNSAKVLYDLTLLLAHFCPLVCIPHRVRQKVKFYNFLAV